MMLLFYDVTWCCDHNCNISVLCNTCYTLSHHLVSSIFKVRGKEERGKQDRKSPSKNRKTLYKKLEWMKNKYTVLDSDTWLGATLFFGQEELLSSKYNIL